MTNKRLKNMIREAYTEVLAEKEKTEKKETPKKQAPKQAPKKVTPKVTKKDLDQTKDHTINTGDAVVAAKKEKIAMSKGDKEDAAFYKKVKDIVNKRKGSSV